jgi:hypothetical protein
MMAPRIAAGRRRQQARKIAPLWIADMRRWDAWTGTSDTVLGPTLPAGFGPTLRQYFLVVSPDAFQCIGHSLFTIAIASLGAAGTQHFLRARSETQNRLTD